MRRYLLDSNAVNSFVNGHEPLSARVRSTRAAGARVGTCEPIVAEMYFGLRLSKSPGENIEQFERELRYLRCWPFDRAAARAYGVVAADLRRRGRPMQIFDMMLAAVATTMQDCVVVTTDSDLSAIPGLRVVNWMLPEEPDPDHAT